MTRILHDERSHRVDPELASVVHREHLHRYEFAAKYCHGKRVLELGCGFGYGASLLAATATSVDAIDLYQPAIEYGRNTYQKPGLQFHLMDALRIAFPDCTFETVISFEVIEHVRNPAEFLAGIRRVLTPDGTLILSTPNGALTISNGRLADPTHLREYTPDQFRSELSLAGFDDAALYGQVISRGVWQVYDLAARVSRRDVLKLRKFLPASWKRRIFEWLVRLRFHSRPTELAQTIIGTDLSGAYVQLAVCHLKNS